MNSSSNTSEKQLFDQEGELQELANLNDGLKSQNIFSMFQEFKTVANVVLMNREGYYLLSNMENELTGMYCNIAKRILDKSSILNNLHHGHGTSKRLNQLNMIRINSCNQELIIFPMDEKHVLLFVQNPSDATV